MAKDRLLTAAEAAVWAKVSRKTMSEWIRGGVIVTIPEGRRKLVRLTHLQQVIRDRAQTPAKKLPPNTIDRSS